MKNSTSQCQQHLDKAQIKCALCGENYTANYKGCPTLKSLMNAKKLSKTKIISDNKPSQNIASIRIVKHHLSNASAVLNKNIVPVNDEFLNSSPSNDMNDLKEMMKRLMSQVSNMMQIITLLFTKIDGQSSSN